MLKYPWNFPEHYRNEVERAYASAMATLIQRLSTATPEQAEAAGCTFVVEVCAALCTQMRAAMKSISRWTMEQTRTAIDDCGADSFIESAVKAAYQTAGPRIHPRPSAPPATRQEAILQALRSFPGGLSEFHLRAVDAWQRSAERVEHLQALFAPPAAPRLADSSFLPQPRPNVASAPPVAGSGSVTLNRAPKTANAGEVDAFIQRIQSETGQKITKTDIWMAAGYRDRRTFETFQRGDATAGESDKIRRVLRLAGPVFVQLAKAKRLESESAKRGKPA